MTRFRTDAKIERLVDLLDLDRHTARWLASVADEIELGRGQRIGHERFGYVVLDGPDAGLVVSGRGFSHVLAVDARVLVLSRRDTASLRRRRLSVDVPRSRAAAGWAMVPYFS